jgi:hypothetical protein
MKPKDLIINSLRVIPSARKYLDDKHHMKIVILELEKQNRAMRQALAPKKLPVILPIFRDDIIAAYEHGPRERHEKAAGLRLLINWVVPAFSPSSGGLTDIYRTISYLEASGHICRTYVYDRNEGSSQSQQQRLIRSHLPQIKAKIFYNARQMEDCNAVIATNWPSAYPVYNYQGRGKKYYYVQDFEPFFEAAGPLRDLSEKTYSFNLRGLTLGGWLAEKLSADYGMRCDSFDLGYNPGEYFIQPGARRKDILFYAQPEKARRGFELGIMALELFYKQDKNIRIHMFGSDISAYKIPFPFTDHGILNRGQINNLYNRCAAGLVLSFTNISLTPLEMVAAGCTPVMNDAYHNRKIRFADRVVYADPNPADLAVGLRQGMAKRTSRQPLPADFAWDKINAKIEGILLRDLTNS